MSRSRPLLLMTTCLLAALACNALSQPSAHSSPETPAAVTSGGIPISATPIRLVIPEGLATAASAETIDVVTEQTGAPWDVAPAHLQLTFQGYAVPTSYHVPQLFVYPVQQYTQMNRAAAESIRRLHAVLSNPTATPDHDALPRVPFFNAGQVIAAQEKIIHFSGGSGVRFITQYAQDTSPINNSGLFYHFQGLTQDGKYYIIAILPANLPFLPNDNDPNSRVPPGGVAFPPSSASGASYEAYFQLLTDQINAASAGDFIPSLDMLDKLLQSIQAG